MRNMCDIDQLNGHNVYLNIREYCGAIGVWTACNWAVLRDTRSSGTIVYFVTFDKELDLQNYLDSYDGGVVIEYRSPFNEEHPSAQDGRKGE